MNTATLTRPTVTVTVPPRFYDDHRSRDCGETGIEVKRVAGRGVTVVLDAEAYDDLLSDARHYAGEAMTEFAAEGGSGICRSAAATVKKLEAVDRPGAPGTETPVVPDPLPVIEPETPASDPAPAAPADPAPIKTELVKVRTGHRVLAYLAATPGIDEGLVRKAATAHRYKDGCSVLELTHGEALSLREAAETLVADTNAPGWNRGAEIGAKAVLRWLDAAGVTA